MTLSGTYSLTNRYPLCLSQRTKKYHFPVFLFPTSTVHRSGHFLAVPHRGSWLAASIVGSNGNRLIRHSRSPAGAMKELAIEYPDILNPYFAGVNARGGPTSLFSLAPSPLLNALAALPIQVPFHSIIGNRGIDDGPESSDGIVSYGSSHLQRAESEKIGRAHV